MRHLPELKVHFDPPGKKQRGGEGGGLCAVPDLGPKKSILAFQRGLSVSISKFHPPHPPKRWVPGGATGVRGAPR